MTTQTTMPVETENRCLSCNERLETGALDYFDTRFGHADLYAISSCPQCGLEQTLPRPAPQTLQHLYEAYYNFGGEKSIVYSHWRERFLNSDLYRIWLALDGDVSFHARKGSGRLLDYGCNEGRGMPIYQKNGFTVEGLEVNTRAAQIARSKGFQVTSSALENFIPSAPFDVVILSNVLEHALDPRQMLLQVRRLLTPSGQVWISCPNSRSRLRGIFGRHWINWHVPFHITHFTESSLRQLVESSGFSVLERHHVTPALWVAQSAVSRVFATRGRPTSELRSPLLMAGLILLTRALLFPFLWAMNRWGQGDCLVMVASRKSGF